MYVCVFYIVFMQGFYHWDENSKNVTNFMGRFIPFDRSWNIKLNKKCDKIQRVMRTYIHSYALIPLHTHTHIIRTNTHQKVSSTLSD